MTTRQLQDLLHYLDYPLDPDGVWGPQTLAAVKAFQKDRGLNPDGDPGPQTQEALKEAVAADRFRPRSSGDFWQDIRHFTRREFACRCGQHHSPYCTGFPAEPEETLVRLADRVRAHFGRPAHLSSGLRCPQHNRDTGGVTNSRHLSGKAMDFFIEGISGQQLLSYIQTQPETNYAYIIGGQYVHMDVE